jgi:hypothetical protein
MGGVPERRAAPEQDGLGRFVLHPGSGRDLLRQRALRTDVYQIGRKVRMLLQEGFDLVQGR